MTEATELRKRQYERFKQLFAIGRQRYLDAGGDPRRSSGSLHGNDYLTEEERQELCDLGSQLGNIRMIGEEIHTAGQSGKIPTKQNEDGATCES
jgi:hypothetical protein